MQDGAEVLSFLALETSLPTGSRRCLSEATISTRQPACPAKAVATQMEALRKSVAVQVSGCRECLSLLMPRRAAGTPPEEWRGEQVGDRLSMLAQLKQEVERLRTIRE